MTSLALYKELNDMHLRQLSLQGTRNKTRLDMSKQSRPSQVNNEDVVEIAQVLQPNAENASNIPAPVEVSGPANFHQDATTSRRDALHSQASVNAEKTLDTNRAEESLELRIVVLSRLLFVIRWVVVSVFKACIS